MYYFCMWGTNFVVSILVSDDAGFTILSVQKCKPMVIDKYSYIFLRIYNVLCSISRILCS